tara:strand:+ start:334 stop:672 length:339 start_codon:yes stop_codon:yes gene_type:complete
MIKKEKKIRINPTVSITGINDNFILTALVEDGEVDLKHMWLEVKELGVVWDNSMWLFDMFELLDATTKLSKKETKGLVAEFLQLSKDSESFIIKNRKALRDTYSYVEKYWVG